MKTTSVYDSLPLIEERLKALVPPSSSPYALLFDAARYSLLGGGKRLRPLLTLATATLCGGDTHRALTPACSLELIHTYSLIHDDLPCMDDDDFRRNKPTLHKKYGEANALLAGDYLLTHAFHILATDDNLTDEERVKLITILSSHSGGHGMIGGQVLDINAIDAEVDIAMLQLIHKKKTGALISAAVEFGAILSGVTGDSLTHLKLFAQDLGLAFQVVDDILDVTQTVTHGKKRSSDSDNNKVTYVSLIGIDASTTIANQLLDSAFDRLEEIPHLSHEQSHLLELANMITSSL